MNAPPLENIAAAHRDHPVIEAIFEDVVSMPLSLR